MKVSKGWKDVVGYEGVYQVSDKGDIYSVERINSQGKKCGGRTLRPSYHSNGYLCLNLNKNGVTKNKKVHRLVLEAFIPNPNNYPEVNHRDEDKSNNNVENLEWCTRKQNVNHGTAIKRASQKRCKKVKAVNVESGEVLTFSSTSEARRKGYAQGHVSKACRGVYKNSSGNLIGDGHLYRGHQWSYEEEETNEGK